MSYAVPRSPTQGNQRLIIGLSIVGFLYVGSSVAALIYYHRTQCPYTDAQTCKSVNVEKCGSDQVFSKADCRNYAYSREPCFCTQCQNCYDEKLLKHCELPAEKRNQICTQQMPI